MALLAGACTSPLADYSGYAEPRAHAIGCIEAHRYAARALKANGYAITVVRRTERGGVVAGRREASTMEMRLDCGAQGVHVDASGPTPYSENGMRIAFARVADAAERGRTPPTGLEIDVELLRDPEAALYFSTPLAAFAVVCLRVRVANGSSRAVAVAPAGVRLETSSGRVVRPLEAREARRRLASALAEDDRRLLRETRLEPGAVAEGELFYPEDAYVWAVLDVVDVATGEPDEFRVRLGG